MNTTKKMMPQQNTMKRFEALDAFRGLAAIIIVLFHSQFYADTQPNIFVRHGYVFVDFFFILSGFVIAYSYQDKILNGIGFKKFMLLRFARLYPLHLFILFVWIPYVGIKMYLYQQGIGVTDPTIINNIMTFLKNIFLLQGIGSISWNYPSWSIGVEFYTYGFFFLVMFLSIKSTNNIRFIMIVLISLAVYIMALNDECILINFFKCISEFFFGVIVYYGYKNIYIEIKKPIVATLLEISSLMLMIYLVSNIAQGNNYEHYTVVLFMAIVYLFAIENIGVMSKLLSMDLFQYLGKISYSIYMTHAIIVTGTYNVLIYLFKLNKGDVVGVPSGVIFKYAVYLDIFFIIIVLGLSSLTYKYIEIPGQSYLKKRIGKHDK